MVVDEPPRKSEESQLEKNNSTDKEMKAQQRSPPESSKFKCSICFESPLSPVVTTCGHMYCWRCLHNWLDRGTGQCPVCKSGVKKETIIPIYCDDGGEGAPTGDGTAQEEPRGGSHQEEAGQALPNRPRGQRMEPPLRANTATTGASIQFGFFFPFGIGLQFNSPSAGGGGGRVLTAEEQRSQLISYMFIFFAVAAAFWAIFVDSSSSTV